MSIISSIQKVIHRTENNNIKESYIGITIIVCLLEMVGKKKIGRSNIKKIELNFVN